MALHAPLATTFLSHLRLYWSRCRHRLLQGNSSWQLLGFAEDGFVSFIGFLPIAVAPNAPLFE